MSSPNFWQVEIRGKAADGTNNLMLEKKKCLWWHRNQNLDWPHSVWLISNDIMYQAYICMHPSYLHTSVCTLTITIV